jgi:Outer membrane lipoprotein carrier protein LolA-like
MSRLSTLLVQIVMLVPGAAAAAPEWGVQDLMNRLAAVTQVEAKFTERKTLAILREPLLSSGMLRYRSPDYLQKQVVEPRPETYEVKAGHLFIEIPGEDHTEIDLDQYPPLRSIVESIRATMAGDLNTLARFYRIEVSGQAEGWTLRLESRDEEIARYVTTILIGGRDARVLAIDTLESDGDRSVMTLTPLTE